MTTKESSCILRRGELGKKKECPSLLPLMFADLQFMGCGADFECEQCQCRTCCVLEEGPCTGATLGKDELDRITFVHPCKGTASWFWHDSVACIDTNANTQMFELWDKTNRQHMGFWLFFLFFFKHPTFVQKKSYISRVSPAASARWAKEDRDCSSETSDTEEEKWFSQSDSSGICGRRKTQIKSKLQGKKQLVHI